MNASRKPLPNKLKQIISNDKKNAGKNNSCGYASKLPFADAIKAPIDVSFSPLKLIIPKYVSIVSDHITPGITSTVLVTIVPSELGKMCLNIILGSLAPSVRAAKTYSYNLKR